jgi:hypothetical protein
VKLEEIASAVAPFIPPALGSLAGLPYAKSQTPAQKCVSWAVGVAAGFYVGGAVAEFFELRPKGTIAAGFLFGTIGYDLMLAVTAAAKNPLQSFKDWWGAWRNP